MKRSRWTAAAALLSISALLFSGCASVLRPPNPVPPRLASEQAELSRAAERNLPSGAQLTSVRWPANSSSYLPADTDADGTDEMLVTYREAATATTGVLILKRDGDSWRKLGAIAEQGREIDRVQVADVTGDRRPEIMIGWAATLVSGLPCALDIYALGNDGKYSSIGSVLYAALAIADVNADGLPELIPQTRGESDEYVSEIRVISYRGGRANEIASAGLDGYPLAVTVGAAAPSRLGIFVDTILGAHSASTQLYFLEGNALRAIFPEQSDKMLFKPYPVISTDVNGDGIVEIGTNLEPVGAAGLSMVEVPWIEAWMQWDGRTGLTPAILERYSDYNVGLQFTMPAAWRGRYTVTRRTDGEGRAITFFYIGADQKARVPLLTIQPVEATTWTAEEAKLRAAQADYFTIANGNGRVYVGINPPAGTSGDATYRTLLLTKDQVKAQFKVLTR